MYVLYYLLLVASEIFFTNLIASIANKDLVIAVTSSKRVGHSANALSGGLGLAEGGTCQSNGNNGSLHCGYFVVIFSALLEAESVCSLLWSVAN